MEFMVSIRQDISVWSKCKFEPMQGAAVWTACCWCACVRFLQKAQDILAKEVLNLKFSSRLNKGLKGIVAEYLDA